MDNTKCFPNILFNVSLLGKWCWQMLVDKEGVWYHVLKARYGEEGGRVREAGRHSSLRWRMLCKVRGGLEREEGTSLKGTFVERWEMA